MTAFPLTAPIHETTISHQLFSGALERDTGPFGGSKKFGGQNACCAFKPMISVQKKQDRVGILVWPARQHLQPDDPVLAKIKNACEQSLIKCFAEIRIVSPSDAESRLRIAFALARLGTVRNCPNGRLIAPFK